MKKVFTDNAEAEKFLNDLISEKKYVIDPVELSDGAGFEIQWIEQKNYTSFNNEILPDSAWVTEIGEMIMIQDLSEAHAKNIIRMILQQEKENRDLIATYLNNQDIDFSKTNIMETPTIH